MTPIVTRVTNDSCHMTDKWRKVSQEWQMTSNVTRVTNDINRHMTDKWRQLSHDCKMAPSVTQATKCLCYTSKKWCQLSHKWQCQQTVNTTWHVSHCTQHFSIWHQIHQLHVLSTLKSLNSTCSLVSTCSITSTCAVDEVNTNDLPDSQVTIITTRKHKHYC